MMKRRALRETVRIAAVAAALALGVGAARGPGFAAAAEPRRGHSEYLASLTQRSLREGLGRESVRLLATVRGGGREAIGRRLLGQVGAETGSLGRRLRLTGLKAAPPGRKSVSWFSDEGYLQVFADGTKLRVRGNVDDPRELERAGGAKLDKKQLEELGRRFVKSALSEYVKLGTTETLSFLGVRYLVDDNARPEAQATEKVVANIAVFGREVDGIPVVGSGSKVAVWFDGNREPVGFDLDWPIYRISSRVQKVLARQELARRVAQATVPLQGGDGVTVRRFECGYVDLGATRRGATIQAGCSLAWEARGPEGEVAAHTEFIPAGVRVLKEARWPLAAAAAEGRIVNTASAEFIRYLRGPKAPATTPANGRPR
jgi:hypothetical protein